MQLPAATGEASMTLGGWHEGLRLALEEHEPGIELAIVSTGPNRHEPFTRGNATYYSLPSPQPTGRAGRAFDAWRGSVTVPRAEIEAARAVIREAAPDLIHLHGTEHFLGLAVQDMDVPCVATLQGIASVYERFMFDGIPAGGVVRTTLTRQFLRGSSPLHAARAHEGACPRRACHHPSAAVRDRPDRLGSRSARAA